LSTERKGNRLVLGDSNGDSTSGGSITRHKYVVLKRRNVAAAAAAAVRAQQQNQQNQAIVNGRNVDPSDKNHPNNNQNHQNPLSGIESILEEYKLLLRSRHKNVISCLGYFVEGGYSIKPSMSQTIRIFLNFLIPNSNGSAIMYYSGDRKFHLHNDAYIIIITFLYFEGHNFVS
jgi:hypothetical protein